MKKRKDNKGRVLKEGETQRKDGIYQYRWTDRLGKRHSIYDGDLKKLREKENELNKSIIQGWDLLDYKTTVIQLMQNFYELKKSSVKPGTKKVYKRLLRKLDGTAFGTSRIIEIKASDAKHWVTDLQRNGLKYSTISSMKSIMRIAFQMAYEDETISKNPFDFKLKDVIIYDVKEKLPLTEKQYSNLLEFVLTDRVFKKYYEEIVFLYETGVRVSEFCGLTIRDIDFVNKEFTVDKQLIKEKSGVYYIADPKSKAGFRTIPLSDEAYKAIRTLIARRPRVNEVMVDGYCGFILVRSNGLPKSNWNIEYALRQIVKAYNQLHQEEPLPNITPHTLRHTFCTMKIKSGMNIKAVQYLMGHSKVQTTLDIYTAVKYDDVKSEFERVENL